MQTDEMYFEINEALVKEMYVQIRKFEARHALLQDLDDRTMVNQITKYIEKRVREEGGVDK